MKKIILFSLMAIAVTSSVNAFSDARSVRWGTKTYDYMPTEQIVHYELISRYIDIMLGWKNPEVSSTLIIASSNGPTIYYKTLATKKGQEERVNSHFRSQSGYDICRVVLKVHGCYGIASSIISW